MRLWLGLLVIVLFSACKTYQFPEQSSRRLQISEGGGFTGAVHSWVVLPNGQLFSKSPFDTVWIAYPKIKKKIAQTYFAQAFVLINQKANETNNMTREIRLVHKDTSLYAIWPAFGLKYPERDSLFSKITSHFIPQN